MNHLDLFSGIGGFALAARWCGFKTIGFSETDGYCSKILKRHWPDVPNYGDIRALRGIPCDLITGGFPCQPFSLAGKRGGASDDRALWPEMLRVIAESKPRWVLGENVPGIINMELDRVLSDLEGIGYSCWPIVIPACAVDARHRRSRVWIVGYAKRERSQRRGDFGELAGKEGAGESNSKKRERFRDAVNPTGEDVAYSGCVRGRPRGESCGQRIETANGSEALANGISAGLEERQEQSAREEREAAERNGDAVSDAKRKHDDGSGHGASEVRGIGPEQAGVFGVAEWEPEPAIRRVANGVPNRIHRLKGLGNSIVPQVAYEIMRHMKVLEHFPRGGQVTHHGIGPEQRKPRRFI